MRNIRYVLPLVILLLCISCEVKIPDNVIPPDRMEAFLYDYHLVQAMSGEYVSDDYKEKLYYEYVFNKHNIVKEQFDTAMMWYNRYPKHLKRIYESLTKRLEREVEKMNGVRTIKEEGVELNLAYLNGDSVDLWTSSKIKQFSSNSLNNKLTFSFTVPDDTTFVRGDSLSFVFNSFFIADDSVSQEAYASVSVEYDGGGLYTNAVRIDSVGVFNVPVTRNFDDDIKSMCGFVYYADNDTTARSRMLLGDISLLRIHPRKQNKK